MQYSDLHIHSRYSDGTLWPEEIIGIAMDKGVKCISITDHDTIDSQYALRELGSRAIQIIPGVELSTEYKGKEIHILGYFIDLNNKELNDALEQVKLSRRNRAIQMIDKLNDLGINVCFEDISTETTSIGRPHIAKLLVEKGLSKSIKEAFQHYLIKGKPAYVDRYKIDYKKALKIISNANGVPVLAHPGEIYKGLSTEELIKEFKVYGLKGLEVFHPSHSSREASDYYNLARKYSLTITGGSDCHGIYVREDLLIGTVGIDENLTNKLLRTKIK
jgi:predicted metal-dependent phosphoesterase TrpH